MILADADFVNLASDEIHWEGDNLRISTISE